MYRRTLLALGALVTISLTAGAQARIFNITASNYKFDAPDSIAAGVITFKLVSVGPELHHVQLARLEQGKTIADFEAAIKNPGPPPAWVTFVGGPNASIPDGQHPTTVTATLSPGNYVMLCIIPSPDGSVHLAKGMYRGFRVTAGSGVVQAGEPMADAVLTLYDYNFDLDKPLKAGKRTILIKNTATQWHEAFLAKLPPNTPVNAFPEWVAGGMKGPPPIVPEGGIVALNPGFTNVLTVDLEAGDYVLYCFLADAKDGKEHVQHGMLKKITVEK